MAIPAALAAQLTPEQLAALERATGPGAFGQYPQRIPQQMLPYRPSVTDRVDMGASDLFGNDQAGRRRQGMVNRYVQNLTPLPAADVFGRAVQQYNSGDYLGSAINTGLGAMSVIPIGKGPAKAAQRIARDRADMGVSRSRDRIGTTGQYIGAPQGVNTPQKLRANRDAYMDLVREGDAGRNWYQDSSEFISRVTPDDERAQQIANITGITSAGTGVDPNLGFTIKGVNQSAAGMPVRTGRFPNNQSALIEQTLAGQNPPLGPKREPFAQNLAVNFRPDLARFPVHDIWQGRAFGYQGKKGKPFDEGFSPQQHAFLDRETDAIIDRFAKEGEQYDPLSVQAAAWTGAKIRSGELDPSDAAKHYGDFAEKYEAAGTFEQIPGAGTGMLEGIVDAPFGQRQDYSNRVSWNDGRGRDSLYSAAGLMTEPSRDAMGAFTPASGITEFNPATVARPLTQTNNQLLQADRQILNVTEAARAFVDAQNAGAYHRVIPSGQTKAGERTSLEIDLQRPVSQRELDKLNSIAQSQGYFAVDYGNGVRFINDAFESPIGIQRAETMGKTPRFGTDELKQLQPQILEVVGDANINRVKIDSGYLDYESALAKINAGSGMATQQFLDYLSENATVARNIEPRLRAKAAENLQRDANFSTQTGMSLREDIQNARRILADTGIEGLRDALAKGALLPAAVGAVLLGTDSGSSGSVGAGPV